MKSVSHHFLWRLTAAAFLSLFVVLFVSPARAQIPVYTSPASVTTPPQVDATTFINGGIWNIISTPTPYQTKDTLNYYNSGSMSSQVGWDFDFKPGDGSAPGWSANFTNDNRGNITAASGQGSLITQLLPVGYLLISATNILNKGALSADVYSLINLTGSSVNLSRSQIFISPITSSASANDSVHIDFTPSAGVYDEEWGQAGISNVYSAGIWNGTNAASPTFKVNEPCGESNVLTQISSFTPTFSDSTNVLVGILSLTVTNMNGSTTNVNIPTNVVRQAVFIYCPNSNITGQVRFSPSQNPTNFFSTVAVQLSSLYTNFTTFAIQTNSIFLVDTLASTTNGGYYTNLTKNPYAECSGYTYRPGNYVLSRTDPGDFAAGLPGAGTPTNTFLYERDFTNLLVSGIYGGYSADIDNQAVLIENGSSITNIPGRVQIIANNLNLNQTSIRGEGEIAIQASNLVNSVGAVVDSQYLSYNLGSTNGFLNITNLAVSNVSRFQGLLSCFSMEWSNAATVITTNYTISTTNPPVYSPLTNSVQVGLYVLIVDASQLTTTVPVTVQDLVLHSTNIVVSDSMDVAQTLFFDGSSLTLNGSLYLGNLAYFNAFNFNTGLQNWGYTNAPALRYFTNNNSLYIPGEAHFGDDGPTNYLVFDNNGTIYSSGQTINSSLLQINNGFDTTSAGNFQGIAQTGQLTDATIQCAGDIQFFANSLKINQSALIADGALDFTVTNSLFDIGAGSGNIFTIQSGFNLVIKPQTGDLLGTTFNSIALGNNQVVHSWAALDRGTNYSGFTNNVAVGELALVPENTVAGREPLFEFKGTGPSSNAMYVAYLDLSELSTNNLSDLQNQLQIDPGMTIYYANVKLGFTPPSGTAAQYLNGQSFGGGQLKWIQGYSSLGTKLSGSYITSGTNAGSFQLTFSGVPGQPYDIQATTNLLSTNWVTIATGVIGSSVIPDPNAANFENRFYRAVPEP
jgi:hypothetical protein